MILVSRDGTPTEYLKERVRAGVELFQSVHFPFWQSLQLYTTGLCGCSIDLHMIMHVGDLPKLAFPSTIVSLQSSQESVAWTYHELNCNLVRFEQGKAKSIIFSGAYPEIPVEGVPLALLSHSVPNKTSLTIGPIDLFSALRALKLGEQLWSKSSCRVLQRTHFGPLKAVPIKTDSTCIRKTPHVDLLVNVKALS